MNTNLTIFLCSTYSDLQEERSQVLEGIRKLQLQHDSMEFFGARDGMPIETCLDEVRKSNIVVIIVGHRYGSIVPDMNISFSEAEYNEGHRLKKPCLVYMRRDDVPILPKYMENNPDNLKRLVRWKETLNKRHTIASFSSAQDLAMQVVADLIRAAEALEETEKVRSEFPHPQKSREVLFKDVDALVTDALNNGLDEETVLSVVRRAINEIMIAEGRREALVFLSYAVQDRPIVSTVASRLRDAGINIWQDVNITPGRNWLTEIENGLRSADFVVFFISKNSSKSEACRSELSYATTREIEGKQNPTVIPIMLEDAEIPLLLMMYQYLDMRGDFETAVQKLIQVIRHYQER